MLVALPLYFDGLPPDWSSYVAESRYTYLTLIAINLVVVAVFWIRKRSASRNPAPKNPWFLFAFPSIAILLAAAVFTAAVPISPIYVNMSVVLAIASVLAAPFTLGQRHYLTALLQFVASFALLAYLISTAD